MQIKTVEIRPIQELEKCKTSEHFATIKLAAKLAGRQKDYSVAHKSSFKGTAKVLYVLNATYVRLLAEGDIGDTMTFPEWVESNTGSKPNNHAQSMALAFGAYVRDGWLNESQFDTMTDRALEKAAAIYSAAGKKVEHEAVIATAKALLKPTENKVKFAELEAIHATLKEPKVMKVDEARELAGKIAENRLQSTALREFSDTLGDNVSEENGPRKLKAIFMEANRLVMRFNEFVDDATLASWASECETAYLATLTQPASEQPVGTRNQDTPVAAAA